MGEWAEQHGNQLGPAVKAFGAAFRIVCFDQRAELGPGKMLKQLMEQTRDLYDGFPSLWVASDEAPTQERFANALIIRGLFFCSDESQTCFGQE
jgi:hypothetical protein